MNARTVLLGSFALILGCEQAGNPAPSAVGPAAADMVAPATASSGAQGGRDRGEASCGNLGVNFGSHKCKVDLSTGITMAYLETGPENGPTVILIHGLTDSIRSWILSMRALHAMNPGLHMSLSIRGVTAQPRCRRAPSAPAPRSSASR